LALQQHWRLGGMTAFSPVAEIRKTNNRHVLFDPPRLSAAQAALQLSAQARTFRLSQNRRGRPLQTFGSSQVNLIDSPEKETEDAGAILTDVAAEQGTLWAWN
jgi:hypothetical protein